MPELWNIELQTTGSSFLYESHFRSKTFPSMSSDVSIPIIST